MAPKSAPGGAMPLMAHLREFRQRLMRSAIAIVIASVICWFLYEPLFDWLTEPFRIAEPALKDKGVDTELIFTGIGGAFQFQLKISIMAGILLASPVWMWQFWAFVLPAMHRNEKKAAAILTATCVPLFAAGAFGAYYIMPNVVRILIGFVPESSRSLLSAQDYYTFLTRLMLVFGLAALLPVAVISLNRIGVLRAETLIRARPWTIVGIFVLSAVATPTPDPGTMLFMAVPMTLLYLISEVVARIHDRRHPREEI